MVTNRLRELRREHELSQLVLADAVLTTRQTIHAIESGKNAPSLELALRLADYFGVRVEDIFGLKQRPKVPDRKVDPFSVF